MLKTIMRLIRVVRSGFSLAGIGLIAGLPGVAQAQAPTPATLQIPRVTTPPRLEDYLGTGAAPPGLAVTDFRQRNPKDLEPATEPTTAYLSYDDTYLYAAFVCGAADASAVRARMARRESIFSDDHVGLYLDTFLDKQRAYVFLVSPLGIQADGILSEGQGEDYSFDTEWHTRGRVTASGYVVWMAIPFKSLRFPTRDAGAQRWGVALSRVIPAKDEADYAPGITERVNGFVSQFAPLEGLAGVHPGRNVQFIPYGTFTGARFLDPAGYVRQNDGRVGIDGKFVVRDAVTFDLTANPDFSQVESDEPQVTVNQRFEVFFPEKRPFFLENADYFQTPTTLFFSRRIRDPRVGARVTGKAGQWAFGAIVMDDRAPGQRAAPGSAGSGDGTLNSALRARFDFSNQSSLGAVVTTRAFGPSSNEVVSVDTRVRLNPRWFITAQSSRSAATALDGTKDTGWSTYADLSRGGRAFNYSLTYADASPGFRTQLGFVPRLDMRQLTHFLTYRWRPKKGPVVAFGPNSFAQATWDYARQLQDWIVRVPFNVDLRGRTNVFARHAVISEKVGGVDFRQQEDLIQFFSEYIRWMGVGSSFSHGTRPNYSPASDLAPFLGTFTDGFVSLTFRPISALLVDETYLYSRLDARKDSPGSGTIFSNHILRSRVNYQFTREWSLRAIVDYNTLAPNPALVALDRQRHLAGDVLLTWLPHPGTALYVGYTDGYDNLRLDPLAGLVPTPSRLASTGRQVFVKSSWLLRF